MTNYNNWHRRKSGLHYVYVNQFCVCDSLVVCHFYPIQRCWWIIRQMATSIASSVRQGKINCKTITRNGSVPHWPTHEPPQGSQLKQRRYIKIMLPRGKDHRTQQLILISLSFKSLNLSWLIEFIKFTGNWQLKTNMGDILL